MQQSLFRSKAFSFPGVCELCSVCKRKCIASVIFEDILSHDILTWKNCHVWGCVRFAPIAPLRLSDMLSIRFPESQILHGCRSRCTWHSYSKLVKSLWTRWNSFRSLNEGNSNLTNKNAVKLFLRKMECANASPSHQTNGQAGFICTLFMLCGFMYTLNVVWCVKSLVWFYVHFLCCAVYSVVLYTLSMFCGV